MTIFLTVMLSSYLSSLIQGLILGFGVWAMMWAVTIGTEEHYWWRGYQWLALVVTGGTDE